MSDLTITKRILPHWTLAGSWYYVTFRLKSGVLTDDEKDLVLGHIKSGNSIHYRLVAASVMPDHVHVIFIPNKGSTLSGVMQLIKGAPSRYINLQRGARGPIWQEESWDRIIRDETEFRQKLDYMMMNPVNAGLVADPWSYRWWYLQSE